MQAGVTKLAKETSIFTIEYECEQHEAISEGLICYTSYAHIWGRILISMHMCHIVWLDFGILADRPGGGL
jgi:hypothetical protein